MCQNKPVRLGRGEALAMLAVIYTNDQLRAAEADASRPLQVDLKDEVLD